MKLGDGLFLNTFRKVAEEYKSTGIEANDMIIDNTCVFSRMPRQVQLISPSQFHAARCQAKSIRRYGDAQPVWRNYFQHWSGACWWPWYCPWL